MDIFISLKKLLFVPRSLLYGCLLFCFCLVSLDCKNTGKEGEKPTFNSFKSTEIQKIKSRLFTKLDKGSMPGSMIIDKEKSLLYIFEYPNKKISVWNLLTREKTGQIILEASPYQYKKKEKHQFYITVNEPVGVMLLNINEKKVLASLVLEGEKAADFCYSEKFASLFITVYDRPELFIVDEGLKISKKMTIEGKPGKLLLDEGNGKLYISNETSKCEIIVLDLNTLEIHSSTQLKLDYTIPGCHSIKLEDPEFLWNKLYKDFNSLALSGDGKLLIIGCNGMNPTLTESPVYLVNTADYEVKKRITANQLRTPFIIRFNQFSDEVYIICEGSIYVLDSIDFEIRNIIPLGGEISAFTLVNKGSMVLAADVYDNAFYILDSTKNILSRVELGKLPVQMVIDEKGKKAYVSCLHSDEIMEIDLHGFLEFEEKD